MAIISSPEVVAEIGLVYVHDDMSGIFRKRAKDSFVFISPNGQTIKDEAILDRIKKLAIPPSYEKVWICPLEKGTFKPPAGMQRAASSIVTIPTA